MPLYILMDQMPYDEYLGWIRFFKRQPIGWREDLRTAKLMQAFGVKEKPYKIFESLAIMKENSEKQDINMSEKFDPEKFKKSAFFSKLQSAVGGKTIQS